MGSNPQWPQDADRVSKRLKESHISSVQPRLKSSSRRCAVGCPQCHAAFARAFSSGYPPPRSGLNQWPNISKHPGQPQMMSHWTIDCKVTGAWLNNVNNYITAKKCKESRTEKPLVGQEGYKSFPRALWWFPAVTLQEKDVERGCPQWPQRERHPFPTRGNLDVAIRFSNGLSASGVSTSLSVSSTWWDDGKCSQLICCETELIWFDKNGGIKYQAMK